MGQRVFAVVLVIVGCLRAQAQTADFNALVAGSTYPQGSLFSNGGLDFDVIYGTSPLLVSPSGSSPPNPSFSGNFLDLGSGVVLNVNLPTGASQIEFDFAGGTSSIAFIVNGNFFDYNQLPTSIGGVSMSRALPSAANWGTITASGGINSFLVEGTELTIDNLSVSPSPGLAGDYNKNHFVDAADLAYWRKNLNTRSAYNSWRANFGASSSGFGSGASDGQAAVPEPSTWAIVLLLLQGFVALHRRGRGPGRA